MRTLLKNGSVINVFTGEIEPANVLIENDRIIGVGDYTDAEADVIKEVSSKYICPGFIDGHIHIESTMLLPEELAKVCVPHGTTAIVADPHEIANVCGTDGISYMLEASENLPMDVYVMLPSCVPSTCFDEAGAELEAQDLEPFYAHKRVLGLAEMMNYPGVLAGDSKIQDKLESALSRGLRVNGHAPLLSGKGLDTYIAARISDDHECSSAEEAMERIRKGQRVMIRQGTAARNLNALLPLFEEPWASRCMLVTDDKHPADLLAHGHIDAIIRQAVRCGKNPVTGIKMATLGAAEYFGLQWQGAVAPGYVADILVLDDLNEISVCDVYHKGEMVVENGSLKAFDTPSVDSELKEKVCHSFQMDALAAEDFFVDEAPEKQCRVIRLVKGELLTEEWQTELDWAKTNGIDVQRDILKLAVIERHHHTGHKGIGFINGCGLQCGAIASSVSHDSHNLIVIGANENDMAVAANAIREMGGGSIVVKDGEVIAKMPLPIAGLMTDLPAEEIAKQNEELRESVHQLGVPKDIEPFMSMAFVSLPVIPHLKMTTNGLVDVDQFCLVNLVAE